MKKAKIPNILTIFRIFLIVPIVILLTVNTTKIYSISFIFLNDSIQIDISIGLMVAGVLFIISATTDWLDGYLARRWKVISDWGKLWDPLADKVLINSVLIIFAVKGYLHFIVVIIFIVRDIFIDGLRMFAASKNVLISASTYGKLKTIFQIIACCLTFFIFALPINLVTTIGSQVWYWSIQMLFYWISLLFSISSCLIYFIKTWKSIKTKQENLSNIANK